MKTKWLGFIVVMISILACAMGGCGKQQTGGCSRYTHHDAPDA